MTYNLYFIKEAKKEWDKLDTSIQLQFKKKLKERLESPHVLKDKLSMQDNFYKIKLRTVGYHLIYKVIDQKLIVEVIAVAKRDKDYVYHLMRQRQTAI